MGSLSKNQQPQQQTGTSNTLYNLTSVLYHALKAADTYAQYVDDARRAGDEDLAHFFAEVIDGNKQRAERAKQLLARRLAPQAQGDIVDLQSKGSFPASDPPSH